MNGTQQSAKPRIRNVLLATGRTYRATAASLPYGDNLQHLYTVSMPTLLVRLHTHAGLLDDVAPGQTWALELLSRPSDSEESVRGSITLLGAGATGQAVRISFRPNGNVRLDILG